MTIPGDFTFTSNSWATLAQIETNSEEAGPHNPKDWMLGLAGKQIQLTNSIATEYGTFDVVTATDFAGQAVTLGLSNIYDNGGGPLLGVVTELKII